MSCGSDRTNQADLNTRAPFAFALVGFDKEDVANFQKLLDRLDSTRTLPSNPLAGARVLSLSDDELAMITNSALDLALTAPQPPAPHSALTLPRMRTISTQSSSTSAWPSSSDPHPPSPPRDALPAAAGPHRLIDAGDAPPHGTRPP
jgi:hypothetical protein